MRILLSGSLTHILEITEAYPHFRRYIGFLNTPRSYHSFEKLKQYEYPICADNGAFNNFNLTRWNTFIKSITPDTPLQWLSVPDRVEDMKETLRFYAKWRPSLAHLPRALVAQDGAEDCELPWSDFRCLFIGGSTEWKLSGAARDLIAEAQAREKWTHIGRVNSDMRLRYAYNLRVDSIDGTGYSQYSRKYLLKALNYIHGLHSQLTLF